MFEGSALELPRVWMLAPGEDAGCFALACASPTSKPAPAPFLAPNPSPIYLMLPRFSISSTFGWTTSSTRRFFCMSSFVWLSTLPAIGSYSP